MRVLFQHLVSDVSPNRKVAALVSSVDVRRLQALEANPGFDDKEIPRHLQLVGTDYDGELYLAAFVFGLAEEEGFQEHLTAERQDQFLNLYLGLWEYITEPPPWVTDVTIN